MHDSFWIEVIYFHGGRNAAFIRIYADDEMLELIISLPDFFRRDFPERWIKSPISEST
jgi:hypothetical protein